MAERSNKGEPRAQTRSRVVPVLGVGFVVITIGVLVSRNIADRDEQRHRIEEEARAARTAEAAKVKAEALRKTYQEIRRNLEKKRREIPASERRIDINHRRDHAGTPRRWAEPRPLDPSRGDPRNEKLAPGDG